MQAASSMYVYIGTYTQPQGKAEGIYVYQMEPSSGMLTLSHTVSGVKNPSFLALHPEQHTLYAVGESDGGIVNAYVIEADTGALTFINQQPSHGDGPCHVSVDQSGRWVLVANYGSGSIAIYPVQSGGSLGPASDTVQHTGQSVNPKRQQGPHAHWISTDPSNRYAVVADLGLDRLMVYRLDETQGKLIPNDPPWATMRPGAGPRQIAFHPQGHYAYVLNEIDATLDACIYDASAGSFQLVQTVPMLPPDYNGTNNSGAAIRVEPSGRFVYASNRGHDSIVIHAIDQTNGMLSYVGHTPTQGRVPRDFGIDPSGTFLLAANQSTNTIVTFRIDQGNGQLIPTGHVTETMTPVCVIFHSPR